jgi:hypothetical protein
MAETTSSTGWRAQGVSTVAAMSAEYESTGQRATGSTALRSRCSLIFTRRRTVGGSVVGLENRRSHLDLDLDLGVDGVEGRAASRCSSATRFSDADA